MPLGTAIHNIEIALEKGGQLARATGAVVKLIAKEGKSATLRLPSREVRLISKNCLATVGQVGNVGVNQKSLGRAGSKRWLATATESVCGAQLSTWFLYKRLGGRCSASVEREQRERKRKLQDSTDRKRRRLIGRSLSLSLCSSSALVHLSSASSHHLLIKRGFSFLSMVSFAGSSLLLPKDKLWFVVNPYQKKEVSCLILMLRFLPPLVCPDLLGYSILFIFSFAFVNCSDFLPSSFISSKEKKDPFAEANADNAGAGSKEYVHIRVQQRNGRKSLTTVQGLKKEYSKTKILKDLKKEFCCNGTVVEDPELGQVIQLQGDQRKNVSTFLVQAGIVKKEQIKIHGF
ncbi:hypothetical protein HPP92_026329 [Vanilla planifolia]|uniref:Protein translation factor SUI1 homolog n=1 Tax=Vanilla planifolia TaxID=51239 RepID=A0A835U6D2_VANPL|nr:hypothetical protein HPP92_026329 [Vanilla planifolia]